ncbi:hypothetical protein [Planococcus koreensis]|uniref:hypothetical protein n=1 Tax=Planococcus koreensis TaxID=112331 RepID=UPI0039FC1C43
METSNTLSMEEELMAARENRFELLKLLSELGALDRDILMIKLIHVLIRSGIFGNKYLLNLYP